MGGSPYAEPSLRWSICPVGSRDADAVLGGGGQVGVTCLSLRSLLARPARRRHLKWLRRQNERVSSPLHLSCLSTCAWWWWWWWLTVGGVLRRLFEKLCEDEMPMVRKSAAVNIGLLVEGCAPEVCSYAARSSSRHCHLVNSPLRCCSLRDLRFTVVCRFCVRSKRVISEYVVAKRAKRLVVSTSQRERCCDDRNWHCVCTLVCSVVHN